MCALLPLDGARPTGCAAVAAAHAYEAVPAVGQGRDARRSARRRRAGGATTSRSAEHDVMHEVMGPQLAELGYLDASPVGLA